MARKDKELTLKEIIRGIFRLLICLLLCFGYIIGIKTLNGYIIGITSVIGLFFIYKTK